MQSKRRILTPLMISALVLSSFMLTLTTPPIVSGQEPTILSVNGLNGVQQNYTLTQIKAMPSVSLPGGYYQPNQNQLNSGTWTGVSVLYLCNQVGGITSNNNVTVTGQGNNTFTYTMINDGTTLNSQYKTYNNQTGIEQNQTQPITLILAYQFNSTNVPSNQVPRLVIVGPEGLLMDGSGGRSVTSISITNIAQTPTPTPTLQPTPSPTVAPTLTPTPTPTHNPTPTATPSPTATPTATPTPTVSPTPTGTGSGEWPITYTAIIIVIIAIIVIATVIIFLRKR